MGGPHRLPHEYTKTEKEVIGLLLKGYSNKAMATKLFVELQCIKWHLTRIYKKAGVTKDREFLALYIPKEFESEIPHSLLKLP